MSFTRAKGKVPVTPQVGALVVTDEAIRKRAQARRGANQLARVQPPADPWGRK